MADEGEIQRLETLWSEEFGDRYVDRNRAVYDHREPLWRRLHAAHPFESVLEVGCNLGGNLRWLAGARGAGRNVWGVDINASALREARATLPDVNAVNAPARSLPFRDARFDLTFSTGVLIHQPPEALPVVMSEIVRCSRRYVLCGGSTSPRSRPRCRTAVSAARCSSATGAPSTSRCSRSCGCSSAASRGERRHGLGRRDVLALREEVRAGD